MQASDLPWTSGFAAVQTEAPAMRRAGGGVGVPDGAVRNWRKINPISHLCSMLSSQRITKDGLPERNTDLLPADPS
ncbi:hypothetical protein AGIG_G21 [Arapaima gigas]